MCELCFLLGKLRLNFKKIISYKHKQLNYGIYSVVLKSNGFKIQKIIKLEMIGLEINIKHIVTMVNL